MLFAAAAGGGCGWSLRRARAEHHLFARDSIKTFAEMFLSQTQFGKQFPLSPLGNPLVNNSAVVGSGCAEE